MRTRSAPFSKRFPSPVWTRDPGRAAYVREPGLLPAPSGQPTLRARWRRAASSLPRPSAAEIERKHTRGSAYFGPRPAVNVGDIRPRLSTSFEAPTHRARQRRHMSRRDRTRSAAVRLCLHGRRPSAHARPAVDRGRHIRRQSQFGVLQFRLSHIVGNRCRVSRPPPRPIPP